MSTLTRFRLGAAVIGVLVAVMALGGCGTAGSAGSGGATLSLVGFSTPRAANNAIEAAWARTPEGQGVSWQESYGASGDVSRAVTNGLKADYVHFSQDTDMTRLVDAGLVDPRWNIGPTKGIVSRSVVALAVRKGNPKRIAGWDDLVKPGVGIVTPNPGSSGSARWNILAAYGQVIANGGNDNDAKEYLTAFFGHVVALPGSARDATTAFTSGTGDVLVTYENEAILARQNGQDFDYLVPDTTLRIDNPGAVLNNANPRATTWLAFVLGKTGQIEFAKKGFRPVIEGVSVDVAGANDPQNPYPAPKKLLTIADDFGGWPAADKEFFDQSSGLVTEIQRASGK